MQCLDSCNPCYSCSKIQCSRIREVKRSQGLVKRVKLDVDADVDVNFDVDLDVDVDVDLDVDVNFNLNLNFDVDVDVNFDLNVDADVDLRLFIHRAGLPFQREVGVRYSGYSRYMENVF